MAPSSGNLSCLGRRKLVTATAALPITLLLLLVAGLPGNPVAANPDAKRLYDDLLSNYNKLVRPVVNTTDVLKVCIKLKLSQLIDVVSGWELVSSLLLCVCVVCVISAVNIGGGKANNVPVHGVLHSPGVDSVVHKVWAGVATYTL